MNRIPTGGAAFPRPGFTASETESQEGMTLRDWFAGQALAGMLVNGFQPYQAQQYGNTADYDYTKAAYLIADSMLRMGGHV